MIIKNDVMGHKWEPSGTEEKENKMWIIYEGTGMLNSHFVTTMQLSKMFSVNSIQECKALLGCRK